MIIKETNIKSGFWFINWNPTIVLDTDGTSGHGGGANGEQSATSSDGNTGGGDKR